MLSFIATFLTFVAFVLLLFAVIGDISNSPVITNIYYFRLDLTAGQGSIVAKIGKLAGVPDFITFGLWSYCYGEYSKGVTYCSPAKLGYEIIPANTITRALTGSSGGIDVSMSKVILGLFLPSIIFAFLALVPGALSHKARLPMLLASGLSSVAFFFTMSAFVTSIVTFSFISSQVRKISSDVQGTPGSATWLTLVAAIFLFFASGSFLFACCCGRKKADDEDR